MPTSPLAPSAGTELRLGPPWLTQSAGVVKAPSPMTWIGITVEVSPPIVTVARLIDPQVKPEPKVAHCAMGALPLASSVAPVCAANLAINALPIALAMTRTPVEPVSRIIRSTVTHWLPPWTLAAHTVTVTYGWLIAVFPSTVMGAVFGPETGVMTAGPSAGAVFGLAGMLEPGVLLLFGESLPEAAGQSGAAGQVAEAGQLGVAGQLMVELLLPALPPPPPPPPQAESAKAMASIPTLSVVLKVFMVCFEEVCCGDYCRSSTFTSTGTSRGSQARPEKCPMRPNDSTRKSPLDSSNAPLPWGLLVAGLAKFGK
jgi:hypothetical protein